jgi:hypothetical protein
MLRARCVPFEVQIVDEAAHGHARPDALIDHAQARANNAGPMLRVGVDWLAEALEEAADFSNYLGWDLEERFGDDDASVDRNDLLWAIGLVVEAYEIVRRVREHRV